MKMNIDPSDIEIKIKLLKSEKTLAQATITLFGEWIEKGWRINRSKNEHPTFHDYIWIQSPCFKSKEKWHEMVYIDNRQLYEEVQAKIFDAYIREKSKNDAVGEFSEITPEEVDKANE
jgi:hypothetical protein